MGSLSDGPAAEGPLDRRRLLNWFLGTSVGALVASILYPALRYVTPPRIAEATANEVEAGDANDPELREKAFKIVRFGADPVTSSARPTRSSTRSRPPARTSTASSASRRSRTASTATATAARTTSPAATSPGRLRAHSRRSRSTSWPRAPARRRLSFRRCDPMISTGISA